MYHEFLIVGRWQREMYLVDEIKDAYDAFQCQAFFKMACNAMTTMCVLVCKIEID
jgi:hypothetical protein